MGSIIGQITNKGATAYALLPLLEEKYGKDSPEYITTVKRIQQTCKAQSMQIDKTKIGKEVKGIPKCWIDRKLRKDCLNGRILLHKRPYFFRYLYSDVNKDYEKFLEKNELQSRYRFGMTLENLLKKPDKTPDELDYCDYVDSVNPLVDSDSVMNVMCHHLEEFRKKIKTRISEKNIFPYYYLYRNNEVMYSTQQKEAILSKFVQSTRAIRLTKTITASDYNYLYEWGRMDMEEGSVAPIDVESELLEVCSNMDIITNVLVDYLYGVATHSSKNLLWQICGNIIYKNVLRNSDYKIEFPFRDKDGDFCYMGNKYSIKEVKLL